MQEAWFERLKEVIENDGRSYRELSAAAKAGPNWVQQMVHPDGKAPGGERLARLLESLGERASVYVLTGVKASKEDLEAVRHLSRLSPEAQSQFLGFLRAIAATPDSELPSISFDHLAHEEGAGSR